MADGPPTNVWDWILPTIVDADTVKQYQRTIGAMRDELMAYAGRLSETDLDAWLATSARVDMYVNMEASFWTAKAQMIAGDAIKAELEGWRAKMIAASPPGGGPPKPSYDKPQSPVPSGGTGIVVAIVVGGLVTLALLRGRK